LASDFLLEATIDGTRMARIERIVTDLKKIRENQSNPLNPRSINRRPYG